MNKLISAAILTCCLIVPPPAWCEILTVSYLERPPYYFTENGKAAGFLIDLTRKIFRDARIEVAFKPLPPIRIIGEIKKADNFHCTVGWFKNPERESFAKFSLPIYQNRPLVLLTKKDSRQRLTDHISLKGVFSEKSFVMGTVSTFSYGSFIDGLIEDSSPQIFEVKAKQSQTIKLISAGRITYILIAPEEIEALIRSENMDPDDFAIVSFPDIPSGNKRYLMFSKGVKDRIIDSVNAAILKIVGPGMRNE